MGGAAWPPSLGAVAFCPLLLRGAAFLLSLLVVPLSPLLLFGGASFLLLLLWAGLLSLPLLLEGTALPSLSLGGVLGGATFPFSSVGWCCLASFVGWCCVIPSLLLRGAAFILSLLVGCFLSLISLGAAWPPSLVGDALFPILLCGPAFLPLLP